MKLNEKLNIVDKAIESISSHTDEDAAVRLAALERIAETVKAKKAAVEAEVKESIAAALG
jgi:hypothetical protein